MKPIVFTPNTVLTTETKRVVKIDSQVKSIIKDLQGTLKNADNPKGVGLAAPQIGINLAICVIWPDASSPFKTYINPVITWSSKKILKGIPGSDNRLEGCLSIPKVWGIVNRHQTVAVKYLDEKGAVREEKLSDFPAIVIAHEIDHLNGILFPRRVLEQKGQLYKTVLDEKGNETLEPFEF